MALKNMAFTKEEIKERNSPKNGADCIGYGNSDKYPYGLTINLEKETLEKLDMSSLPKVGTTMTLTAQVCVTSVSISERVKGEDRKSLSFQIEKMELKPESALTAIDAGIAEANS